VIQNVKKTVLDVIEDAPYDPNALYVLACAESLLGNVQGGIENLEKAINSGYRDINRMVNDIELENIKNTFGFSQVLDKLRGILNPLPEFELDWSSVVLKKEDEVPVVVEEPLLPSLEDKVDKLAEILELPKDLLRDLLVECKEDQDEVVSLIYSTYKF